MTEFRRVPLRSVRNLGLGHDRHLEYKVSGVHETGGSSPRSGRSMCWTVRAFMRYLRYKGYVTADLSAAVPSMRTRRMQSLPGYLSPKQVDQVLKRIDRDGPCGRRDYAILLLLARLDLRANEITTLSLDDIDWQATSF